MHTHNLTHIKTSDQLQWTFLPHFTSLSVEFQLHGCFQIQKLCTSQVSSSLLRSQQKTWSGKLEKNTRRNLNTPMFYIWKVFLSTLKIWQSHKPQKTEVKFSPALKSVSCLRFVPLTFYENQSANLVSGSKRAEEKIFWRWTWLCSAAAKNGFLCPMSKCLGVCRGFCFKPQSCHSKTEMTNKKRASRERENEVINQIQQTDVSENGWCVFLVFSASIDRVTQDSCIIRLYQCPLASWSH